MPNISLTLPDVQQSIIRPVAMSIIQQVQEITKMDSSTKIFYPGDIQRMQTPGSSVDSNTDRFAIFNTERINFIEVEEDFETSALGTVAITREEHIPVFTDPKLLVNITPIYSQCDVTINFTYRCPSKTEAQRWRDDMYIRINQLRDINLHDLTYHYMLPPEILIVLKTIYDKRENCLPYGQSFEEYVTDYATDRLTLVGDLVGKSAELVISEKQTRIIGMFSFDGVPERFGRDDSTGTYSISFSYRFNYQRPIGCNMRYPIMVHNQLLPEDFISFTNQEYDLDKIHKSFSKSLYAMHAFEASSILNTRRNPNAVIRIPEYDDFVLPNVPVGTGTVFIALSEVDPTDQQTLFNLNELGDICIDPDILKFIQDSEYDYVGNLYQSIIHINLYCDNLSVSSGSLLCDSNLNIKTVTPVDLRRQWRVRFSLITDLTLLPKEALDRLRKYPKALVKIISALNELLRNHPDMVQLETQDKISLMHFNALYRILTGYSLNSQPNTGQGNNFGFSNNVNNWPYREVSGSNLFNDLDPRVVENYRNNRIQQNLVQVTGILILPEKDKS